MYRLPSVSLAVLLLVLGATTNVAAHSHSPPAAWPLRVYVSGLHRKPVGFSAVTLGGDLIIKRDGMHTDKPIVAPLARGDTLKATTPAQYPLDLKGGPVVFFTDHNDSIRVVVGRNPLAASDRVAAQGRRLTVSLVSGYVVIEAR